jgi:hypothetical protein
MLRLVVVQFDQSWRLTDWGLPYATVSFYDSFTTCSQNIYNLLHCYYRIVLRYPLLLVLMTAVCTVRLWSIGAHACDDGRKYGNDAHFDRDRRRRQGGTAVAPRPLWQHRERWSAGILYFGGIMRFA